MALLRSRVLARAGFLHAFPERDCTDPELAAALGGAKLVQVRQIHGAAVALASPQGASPAEADALIARAAATVRNRDTDHPLAVGVRVADCVPVLVGDRESGDVAAIHAGWRGLVAGVVEAAVAALGPGSPVAAIGPCIGPCCFEVGPEVAARTGFVVREAGGKAFVDLRAAVRARLAAAGVAEVEDVPGCTKHDPCFHSFRRDGADSGRMLAAIAAGVR